MGIHHYYNPMVAEDPAQDLLHTPDIKQGNSGLGVTINIVLQSAGEEQSWLVYVSAVSIGLCKIIIDWLSIKNNVDRISN